MAQLTAEPSVTAPAPAISLGERCSPRLVRPQTGSSDRLLYAVAVPVVLLGLIPVGFIIHESLILGWAGIEPILFRPRVADLLSNTVSLAVVCILGSVVIGVGAAWLIERTDLPGRRVFGALLVAPLAVPAFVNSYAWASLVPRFEGLAAAGLVTVLSYFPFVYLPVAAALRGLDTSLEESAQALDRGRIAIFMGVVLPQLRVAILGGALLVGLHILAEFGALQMIGYETFTTVILVQYQSTFNGPAATMLAGLLVLCCLFFLCAELAARGRARYARVGSGVARTARLARLGAGRWPTLLALSTLLVLALGVPAFAITRWWLHGAHVGSDLMIALLSTLRLGALGALATTAAAMPIAWLAVRRRGRLSTLLERSAYLTSSLPGVVVALALVTVAIRWAHPVYQTTTLVVVSYLMLFLPRALVNLRTAIAQTTPELDDAARALGASELRRIIKVTLPLIAPGLASGAAFTFLAICTELTATLLLAPAGTMTLATQFWNYSDSLDYAAAAPFAATMIALAAPLTYIMLQQSRKVRRQ
jgi:iron(III) transport system permease protein